MQSISLRVFGAFRGSHTALRSLLLFGLLSALGPRPSAFAQATIANAKIANASFALTNAIAIVGPSTFFTENFEGPGHQEASFSGTSGTINDSYTTSPAPLVGSYSLSIAVASSYIRYIWGASHTEVDCFFYFNASATPGANNIIFRLTDSGATDRVIVYHKSDGTLAVYSGGVGNNTAATLTGGTTYKIWVHAKSNGTGDIAFATTGASRPVSGTQFASTTGGADWTATPAIRVYLNSDQSNNNIFDHVLISDGTGRYGDNP